MIVREWLQQARERLSGFPSAEVDARLLLESIMGRPLNLTDDVALDRADALLARRLTHEPVQYITGEAPFRYLVLHVGPGVLIPRPETEVLVDLVKDEISDTSKVVDLGAGSGAIAIAIASETGASVTAVEKDPEAFTWLMKNVSEFAPKVTCIQADVLDVQLNNIDVVVANPPYVPASLTLDREVHNYEPHQALFGGADGLEAPHLFMRAAAKMLRSGGRFVMEHDQSHQDRIVDLAKRYFVDVHTHQDLAGRPRFISARLA